MSFLRAIVERVGYRRAILTMIPLLTLLYAIVSFAQGALSFVLLLSPLDRLSPAVASLTRG